MNGQETMDNVMPAMADAGSQSGGVLQTIKEKLHLDGMLERVKSSKDRLVEIALFLGIGFIAGFLFKKYSSYVIVCILAVIGLGVLHHLGVITIMINWDRVTEVFGIQAAQQTMSADNLIATVWEWVRLNMVISISFIVGLFVGLKVG